MPMRHPSAILFACTMNAIRSPMAAALLRHLRGRSIWVESVGVRCGEPDPLAIEVMREIGIDIAGHSPKTFEDLEDDSFDLVVSLSPEAQHKAVEITRTVACDVEYWRIFDPSMAEGTRESRLAVYRQVRDDLFRQIETRFPIPIVKGPDTQDSTSLPALRREKA